MQGSYISDVPCEVQILQSAWFAAANGLYATGKVNKSAGVFCNMFIFTEDYIINHLFPLYTARH